MLTERQTDSPQTRLDREGEERNSYLRRKSDPGCPVTAMTELPRLCRQRGKICRMCPWFLVGFPDKRWQFCRTQLSG